MSLAIVVIIIASTSFYFKFKKSNVEIGAGDVVLNIDYNKETPAEDFTVKNETNKTLIEEINLSEAEKTESFNYTNIS